jgi:heterodisulfide reductase subunit A
MGRRIGVFICHCGKNIAGGIDVKALYEHVSHLQDIEHVDTQTFSCSEEGQTKIRQAVREHDLKRVVIAACDPALHLATFQRCMEKEGIDPSFVSLVDIRKWTMHGSSEKVEPHEALEKAKSLIALTVKRLRLKKVIPKITVEVTKTVVVIGGGIAGVEASLDLAEKGYSVVLVERSPTIGGKMALLYKVFPTNDCAPCILAPKTAYANSNPLITIMTNSRITNLQGHVGKFEVTVEEIPRYIDEGLCTGCGECIEKCPVRVPDEYSFKTGTRKAVYIPFPQAIPHKPVIDSEHCLFFRKERCRICEKICPRDAVKFTQRPGIVKIDAGAIIVATGFEEFDPVHVPEYGYGRYENVLTQQQLARILDIDGPTGGDLVRPSDRRIPRRIVMIQCVGSRDRRTNEYCSKICCMYALKHAQIIKETLIPDAEITLCYIDMRTGGKGFEEYYRRSREFGITFIRGRPAEIQEEDGTKNLLMRIDDPDTGCTLDVVAELVALSCAMVPSHSSRELATVLGIERDRNGFFQEIHPKLRPVETVKQGIFIAGCAQGPKDIPDSIMQAKSAASCADTVLRKGSIELPARMVRDRGGD